MNRSSLTYEFIDPDEQIGSEDFVFVERFLKSTRRMEIGWHYITDIAWIYGRAKHWPRRYRVLDAGGGSGPLQFLLAELGFDVTNIDMVFPPDPLPVYIDRYRLAHRKLQHFQETEYANRIRYSPRDRRWPRLKGMYRTLRAVRYSAQHNSWRVDAGLENASIGNVEWIVGNLCNLREIPSGSFDAVVSLSSLEHIPLEQLGGALTEISRVLTPNAGWAVTTSATEKVETWLHQPSQGWCYSIADLETRFGAMNTRGQNPVQVLERYRRCAYLKGHLAGFYRRGGNNGMPWGIWDPQYIPVGLSRGNDG